MQKESEKNRIVENVKIKKFSEDPEREKISGKESNLVNQTGDVFLIKKVDFSC